ncbi:hypothetical protein L7F22_029319 [Adiantum nelumboides]|nr:hypothetical protein [Adiantum nelumboides]
MQQKATSFATQANALLRKNLNFQRRKMATNCCLVGFPVLLCTLLVLFQVIINKVLTGPSHSCGCTCLSTNASGICKKECGLEYSTPAQAVFCAIPKPPHWPAVLQVPASQYRAIDEHDSEFPGLPDVSCRWWGTCPISFLHTGKSQLVANDIVSQFFTSSLPSNISDLIRTLSELVPGTIYGIPATNFLEPAFYSGRQSPRASSAKSAVIREEWDSSMYEDDEDCGNMPTYAEVCKQIRAKLKAAIDKCLPEVDRLLHDKGDEQVVQAIYAKLGIADSMLMAEVEDLQGREKHEDSEDYNCLETLLLWRDNFTSINRELYRGYRRGNPSNKINEISAAFDFGNTSTSMLDVTIWYNDTLRSPSTNKPPGMLRLPRSMNLVAQAFLRYLLGSSAQLPLWFVSDMPKSATNLKLDFSALLGPLFFMWVIQLLLPIRTSSHQLEIEFGRFQGIPPEDRLFIGYQYVFGFGLLGAFLFQFFVEDRNFSKGAILLLELLPGFSLYRGLYEFSQYSLTGFYQGTRGMLWKNMKDAENGMRQVFIIMFLEWLLITPVSFYLDQFFQSKRSSFMGKKLKGLHEYLVGQTMKIQDLDKDVENSKTDILDERKSVDEILDSDLTSCAIVCDDLRKVYHGEGRVASKYAVRGLSLAVPCGQCFGMLGPNGAGKTSSINMMIGLSKPTSGTVYIEGLDIRTDMDQIYLCMGVCPQFDLLWESLTGREHLLFYGRLKNLKGESLENAVVDTLRSVNLLHEGVGDKTVNTYSGGMKRRLSVAISLIGDPKVVYMDEPSAGLDPASRNLLWNVVRKAKQGRAIILTTLNLSKFVHNQLGTDPNKLGIPLGVKQ